MDLKNTITQIVFFAILVAVAIAAILFAARYKEKLEEKIEAIEQRKIQIINADSLRSAIEAKIVDSLKVKLKEQDAKIAASTKAINQIRRKNEDLQKRLDDIVVTLPDF